MSTYTSQLVRQVREDAGIKQDTAAREANLSDSAVQRYETGQCPVAVDYYRSLMVQTQDERLLAWILSGTSWRVSQPRPVRTPPADSGSLLDDMLESVQVVADMAIELRKILRDNLVNDDDDVRLARFAEARAKATDKMLAVEAAMYAMRQHRAARFPGRNGH
jgi:DNA-binding XRE family transcriptional regulator